MAYLPPQVVTDTHKNKNSTVKPLVSQPLYTFHRNCLNIISPSNIYVYPKESGNSGHPIIIRARARRREKASILTPASPQVWLYINPRAAE